MRGCDVACENGRSRLSAEDDRRLFAESAGTCLLCNVPLFAATEAANRVLIAERAHVVARSPRGPRGDSGVDPADRDDPANIVLLCSTCHTKVDRVPADYPVERLLALKRARAAAVALVGGTPLFQNRDEARTAVTVLLERNATVFNAYGPDPDEGSLPTTEAAERWSRLVLEEIGPRNDLVVAIVEMNTALTTQADRAAAELLRRHNADLVAKHRDGITEAHVHRFPPEAERIFLDGAA